MLHKFHKNNIIILMNISTPTSIPAEVRERIVAAATELFEQSSRQAMPTVDSVRRAARVDMNAASAVMREWRRAQMAQAAPAAVALPEAVQQAGNAALATIWLQAQELANGSLRNAQLAWEAERRELDAIRQELAEAFERQAGELEAAGAALAAERASFAQQAQELAVVRQQLAEAAVRSDKASAAADAAQLGLLQAQSRAEAAEQVAAQAREQAAGLAGQLQAVQAQNAALLAAIRPQAG